MKLFVCLGVGPSLLHRTLTRTGKREGVTQIAVPPHHTYVAVSLQQESLTAQQQAKRMHPRHRDTVRLAKAGSEASSVVA